MTDTRAAFLAVRVFFVYNTLVDNSCGEARRVIVIQTKGISKTFKGDLGVKKVRALEEMSLEIEQGEVFGFLGPNGAGKSTAIKILLNLIYPDSGSASILGSDVGEKDVRRSVGYLPENPYFMIT
jgi:ABC-2 type transport system ATP-binding protein